MAPKKERSVKIRRARLADIPAIYACQEAAYQNYGSGGLCDQRLLTLQIEAFPEGQLVAAQEEYRASVGRSLRLRVRLGRRELLHRDRELDGRRGFDLRERECLGRRQ